MLTLYSNFHPVNMYLHRKGVYQLSLKNDHIFKDNIKKLRRLLKISSKIICLVIAKIDSTNMIV